MTLNKKENAIYEKLATKDLTFKELLNFFSKSSDISISKPILSANLSNLEEKGLIEKTRKNPRDRRSHKWHVINSDEVIANRAFIERFSSSGRVTRKCCFNESSNVRMVPLSGSSRYPSHLEGSRKCPIPSSAVEKTSLLKA